MSVLLGSTTPIIITFLPAGYRYHQLMPAMYFVMTPQIAASGAAGIQNWDPNVQRTNIDTDTIYRIAVINGCGCNSCVLCNMSCGAWLAFALDCYVTVGTHNDSLNAVSELADLEHLRNLMVAMKGICVHQFQQKGYTQLQAESKTEQEMVLAITDLFISFPSCQAQPEVCYQALFDMAAFAYMYLPEHGASLSSDTILALINWIRPAIAEEPFSTEWFDRFMNHRYHTLILYANKLLGELLFAKNLADSIKENTEQLVDSILHLCFNIVKNVLVKFPVYQVAHLMHIHVDAQYKQRAKELTKDIGKLMFLIRMYYDITANLPVPNTQKPPNWPATNLPTICSENLKTFNNAMRKPHNNVLLLLTPLLKLRKYCKRNFPEKGPPIARNKKDQALVDFANQALANAGTLPNGVHCMKLVVTQLPAAEQERARQYYTTGFPQELLN